MNIYDFEDQEFPEEEEIESLLEKGMEQLDGFMLWLEKRRSDIRELNQDCFNAESLLDFLANYHHKTVFTMNEYEFHWFIYSHYIRKSISERETQERLPESLALYFQYLQEQHQYQIPDWVQDVLRDRSEYFARMRKYASFADEDEEEWKLKFEEWCNDLELDLDARCLWVPKEMGQGMTWNNLQGWREATLFREATNLWMTEREKLMAHGYSYESTRDTLGSAYLIWLDTPQERLDNRSPREVILEERAELKENQSEHEDLSDDDEDSKRNGYS